MKDRREIAENALLEIAKINEPKKQVREWNILKKRVKTKMEQEGFKVYSDQHLYRILKDLNIQKTSTPDNPTPHYCVVPTTLYGEFNLQIRKYNKFICYEAVPMYIPMIVDLLNRSFPSNLFHALFLDDLIVIFYYYEKSKSDGLGKDYLTSSYLKKMIRKILKDYFL